MTLQLSAVPRRPGICWSCRGHCFVTTEAETITLLGESVAVVQKQIPPRQCGHCQGTGREPSIQEIVDRIFIEVNLRLRAKREAEEGDS